MSKARAFQCLDISPKTHTYKQGYDRYRYLREKHRPNKRGDNAEKFKDVGIAWETIKTLLPKSFETIAKPKKGV